MNQVLPDDRLGRLAKEAGVGFADPFEAAIGVGDRHGPLHPRHNQGQRPRLGLASAERFLGPQDGGHIKRHPAELSLAFGGW